MHLRIFLLLFFFSSMAMAQSPGQIVRPVGGGGVTVLNPDGNGYSSATTAGFTSNDITQSEIPYKVVPPAVTEPTGDIATGPSGGFTDIVKTVDGSGFYVYSDGTNLLFRLRIGGIISGSKGYSILIDTDGKMGNSGPAADPNYVAATNTSNGNPGFEYEVVLQTNFQVAVYQVDGTTAPGAPIMTYALGTHSQISMALSTDGNNPDYFYDWYVPLSILGSPASFRMAATTVTSPNSALQGSRSDIFGIDDATGGPVAAGWTTVIGGQPPITVAAVQTGGGGVGPVCTAAPVLSSPITVGSNIAVGGTWTRLDASKPSTATITLYRNGSTVGTTTATTGVAWSINMPAIATGDVFYAVALASGESACTESNHVTAGCTSIPAGPSITCASTKGITGTIPLSTTINIYQVTTGQANPSTTQLTTGLVYVNNATNRTFDYFGTNPQSGNACQGQNNILPSNSTYMFVTNSNGCLSNPVFMCVTGAAQTQWNYIGTNSITLTTPVYPYQTTVSGTGAVTGQLLRLFVNNRYVSAVTAASANFTLTGLSLTAGDVLDVYAQASGACMTRSASFTVSCYLLPPVIRTTSAGNMASSATTIGGTSSSPGAAVQLYRGTAPSGTLVGSATVAANGSWSVGSLTLTAGESYYATQTLNGCTSPASAAAAVLAATTVCPSFASGTYAETASSIGGSIASFTGTVRLYLDGVLMGSTSLTNGTSWSIPVNTAYNNTLYNGAALTVTAQGTGAAENTSCPATATVVCTSPAQPTVTPLTQTINTGQTASLLVGSVVANTWYSLRDNTGKSYATANYAANTSSFNVTTQPFATPGTYSLNVTADKLTGCPSTLRTATITVNSTLPVHFIRVEAKQTEAGHMVVLWTVAREEQVARYVVERSGNCSDFSEIGSVAFQGVAAVENNYQFVDKTALAGGKYCYRIREIDENGRFMFSPLVMWQGQPKTLTLSVAPNPASDRISLMIGSPQAIHGDVALVSMQGVVLLRKSVRLAKGSTVVMLDKLHKFASGSYFIRLNTGDRILTRPVLIR